MVRLTNDQRRLTILVAAHRITKDTGLWDVTHGSVSERCVVPTSVKTVKRVFPTKDHLWQALLDEYADDEELKLQAAGLGFGDI